MECETIKYCPRCRSSFDSGWAERKLGTQARADNLSCVYLVSDSGVHIRRDCFCPHCGFCPVPPYNKFPHVCYEPSRKFVCWDTPWMWVALLLRYDDATNAGLLDFSHARAEVDSWSEAPNEKLLPSPGSYP